MLAIYVPRRLACDELGARSGLCSNGNEPIDAACEISLQMAQLATEFATPSLSTQGFGLTSKSSTDVSAAALCKPTLVAMCNVADCGLKPNMASQRAKRGCMQYRKCHLQRASSWAASDSFRVIGGEACLQWQALAGT